MKRTTLKLLMVALLITLVTVACGFSASTANIASATMSADDTGSQLTTVFSQEDTFYAIIELKNAPDDTTVKAVWTAVDVADTEKGLVIDEFSMTSGDATIPFSLSNNDLWPTGKYKVDIFLNDELSKTLEFEVQ